MQSCSDFLYLWPVWKLWSDQLLSWLVYMPIPLVCYNRNLPSVCIVQPLSLAVSYEPICTYNLSLSFLPSLCSLPSLSLLLLFLLLFLLSLFPSLCLFLCLPPFLLPSSPPSLPTSLPPPSLSPSLQLRWDLLGSLTH